MPARDVPELGVAHGQQRIQPAAVMTVGIAVVIGGTTEGDFTRSRLQQFRNRLAIIEDGHRPAAAVGEGLRGIDPERLVDRTQHLGNPIGAVFRDFGREVVEPITWPIFRPPPAIRADMADGQ